MEQQSISSDLIRGHIDTIILHTLLDGDKFAEQISETIEKKSENAYKINQATLYSALKRLQNIKLLNSYQRDIDIGGRRKFFTLTDKGRETVKENLSSWSYSRAIIDKLIDCESQPIYKTQYVEKIVQVPVEVEKVVYKDVPVEEKKENVVLPTPNDIPSKDNSEQPPQIENIINQQETIQEINFRNIINGLIKACNVPSNDKNEEPPIELDPINRDDITKKDDILNFNQTITENAAPFTRQELESIDFSDLVIKANKEGYKLRVSNKNSSICNGTLLINKLNLLTSALLFLLTMIELLIFSTVYGKLLNLNIVFAIVIVVVLAIYPMVCLIKYFKNQLLTSTKSVSKDIILTSSIIFFNLLLINFAATLLFNLDFSVKKDVILYLIIPIVCYIDILIYAIIKYCLAHSKLCTLVKK